MTSLVFRRSFSFSWTKKLVCHYQGMNLWLMRSSIWLCWNHFPSWVAQPNFGGTWSVVSYYHIISSYCIISVMYLIVSYCNVFHLISVLFSRDCEDLIRDRIIGLPGEFSYHIISTPIIITNLVIMMKIIWGYLVCYQNTIILFFSLHFLCF